MGPVRFDREARSALAAAVDLARELGHDRVMPEHLLYGMLDASPQALPQPHSLDRLRADVVALEDAGHEAGRNVRYDPRAEAVLAFATGAAAREGRSVATVADLLNGLRAIPAGRAESVELFRRAGLEPREEATDRVPDPRVEASEYLFITDLSDLPYYEQISMCVREAVASGVLVPGDRLPPIRRLADHLQVAPGTVARAYRGLEEARVVVTAGASGTRIALPPAPSRSGGRPPIRELAALLRPASVAAYHLGGTLEDLFDALWIAAEGVFLDRSGDGGSEGDEVGVLESAPVLGHPQQEP